MKKRGQQWSDDEIKNALQFRLVHGVKGYEHLVLKQFPLPCMSTINRRIAHIKMPPGILNEVLEWLPAKLATMPEMGKDCILLLDEVVFSYEKIQYYKLCTGF